MSTGHHPCRCCPWFRVTAIRVNSPSPSLTSTGPISWSSSLGLLLSLGRRYKEVSGGQEMEEGGLDVPLSPSLRYTRLIWFNSLSPALTRHRYVGTTVVGAVVVFVGPPSSSSSLHFAELHSSSSYWVWSHLSSPLLLCWATLIPLMRCTGRSWGIGVVVRPYVS